MQRFAFILFAFVFCTQIAASGAFNLGFATMPLVFMQLPLGHLLGFMWFGLLFFAGITSSVAMATPIMAFFREEFGFKREHVAWIIGLVVLIAGMMHIRFLEFGFLDEWDYWAGTFGLAVFATVEVILFMWVYKPENAWKSIHQGADIQLPRVFKFIMTFVTPAYLIVILLWWGYSEALPILTLVKNPNGGAYSPEVLPYVLLSRAIIVFVLITFLILIRVAWKRNGYNDRVGFREVPEDALESESAFPSSQPNR
jgi:neurotransmitter:Na+ symporter, NSS family